MTAERWKRIDEVYHAALELPAPERAAFVALGCGDDEGLLREVQDLETVQTILVHQDHPQAAVTGSTKQSTNTKESLSVLQHLLSLFINSTSGLSKPPNQDSL